MKLSESVVWCAILYLELMIAAARLLQPLYAALERLIHLCAACLYVNSCRHSLLAATFT